MYCLCRELRIDGRIRNLLIRCCLINPPGNLLIGVCCIFGLLSRLDMPSVRNIVS